MLHPCFNLHFATNILAYFNRGNMGINDYLFSLFNTTFNISIQNRINLKIRIYRVN